jgi:RND superfamily putative drug exporter
MEQFFEKMGQFATRYRWLVIIAWLALAVVITLAAPSIEEATTSDVGDLLPVDAPYARAEAILKETFPDLDTAGTAVIVLETPGLNIRDAAPWTYLTELTNWLKSDAALSGNVTEVLSPAGGIPLMADMMVSKDNELALITLHFNADPQNAATVASLHHIRQHLAENKLDGVKTYLTGSGPIITGYVDATMASIDRTTLATVVLVTHDASLACRARRMVTMEDGAIVRDQRTDAR